MRNDDFNNGCNRNGWSNQNINDDSKVIGFLMPIGIILFVVYFVYRFFN